MKIRVLTLFFLICLISETVQAQEAVIQYTPEIETISEELYMNTEIPIPKGSIDYYITEYNGYSRIMLPLRAVLDGYASVIWNDASHTVKLSCGSDNMLLQPGSIEYAFNGDNRLLSAPPEIVDGRIYVPSDFFEDAFGFWMTANEEGAIDLFMPNTIIGNI